MSITIKSNPDGVSGAIQVNGNDAIAFGTQGITQGAPLSFRNKIINGDMRIDQRNAGASVTGNNGVYLTDRWRSGASTTGKFTGQQSSVAPTGFSNSLLITSSSALSVPADDTYTLAQFIEGFNTADLGWGTTNAQPVTLSFWVRSSLTGAFGGSLQNSANNRSYPFVYTISSANTWEYKTITVAGDTSGTWVGATNGIGIRVWFGLGVGTTGSGTAGAWAAADYRSATGATSVVGTSGATFYITGVQLEAGTVATPFEHRPIGTELALCQRYCQVIRGVAFTKFGSGVVGAGNTGWGISCTTKVPMRAAPTISQANCTVTDSSGNYAVTGLNNLSSADSICFDATIGTSSMTPGRVIVFGDGGSANAVLTASAEL